MIFVHQIKFQQYDKNKTVVMLMLNQQIYIIYKEIIVVHEEIMMLFFLLLNNNINEYVIRFQEKNLNKIKFSYQVNNKFLRVFIS